MDKPDDLFVVRRVHRREHVAGRVTLASDDQRVLAPKLRFGVGDGFAHHGSVALVGEVDECFILKWRKHMMSPSLFELESVGL